VVDLTQALITIIGTLVPVLLSLITLAYWLGGKFASIDERFARIDERFERIDERFKSIDKRFEEIKTYVDLRINRLAEASRAYQEFFIEYLSVKGLLRPSEASMLKGEIERFTRLSTLSLGGLLGRLPMSMVTGLRLGSCTYTLLSWLGGL